ncbi:hypothetical protein HYPGJ_20306 [Hyphomicrobium sp. GJ21]|nr:hypothetical protein HYPGJ_20306 [Hyphomicrobium sp. GJ21]
MPLQRLLKLGGERRDKFGYSQYWGGGSNSSAKAAKLVTMKIGITRKNGSVFFDNIETPQ